MIANCGLTLTLIVCWTDPAEFDALRTSGKFPCVASEAPLNVTWKLPLPQPPPLSVKLGW